VSEAKKTYHIRSKTPYDASATIIASSAIHGETISSVISADNSCPPPLLDTETYNIVPVDLSIYMLRQRTQEMIYKAHSHSISDQILGELKSYNEKTKSIKKELIQYLKFMRQYSKENSLEEDEQLNNLIADITIILKTFGGPRAALYSLARGTSQGRQTSNITSYVDPYDVVFHRKRTISNESRKKSFGLQRQYAVLNIQSNDDEQEPVPNPNSDDDSDDLDLLGDLSDNIVPLRPTLSRSNTTPRQIQLMRECSQGTRQDDLNDLDEQTTEGELLPDVFGENISTTRFPFPPIPPTNTTKNTNDIEEGLGQSI
jgi:hypothetical protein